jgi:hypothetical protein
MSLGLTWGQPKVNRRSTEGQPKVNPRSTQGQPAHRPTLLGDPRIVHRLRALRQRDAPLAGVDRRFVDARDALAHVPLVVKFPVLVAICSEPLAPRLGSGSYCSPRRRMLLKSGNEGPDALQDVAGNGLGRHCSTRHRMPFDSRNEGCK